MFIDVDKVKPGFFERLFKGTNSSKAHTFSYIKKKARNYPNYGFIIYETHQGYRVAVIGTQFQARNRQAQKIMRDLGADSLYRTLCKRQNYYRARLTPKPYRIKQSKIRVKFPNRDEAQEAMQQDWVKAYNEKSVNYAVCKIADKIGNTRINPILEYHDEQCKVNQHLTLA